MADLTSRLSLPSPIDGESPNGPDQLAAVTAILDDAAMWDEGAYASRPAAPPTGSLYRQTDSGGGQPAGTITTYTASGWVVVPVGSLAQVVAGAWDFTAGVTFDSTADFNGAVTLDGAVTASAGVTFQTVAPTFSAAPQHAIQAKTATASITATGGRIVTFVGASGQTLTLPTGVIGMEFEILNIDTTDTVTIARGSTDTIEGLTSTVMQPGERMVIAFNAAGTWSIVDRTTNVQTFTANGTWTKPAGAKAIEYLIVGGGSSGGSNSGGPLQGSASSLGSTLSAEGGLDSTSGVITGGAMGGIAGTGSGAGNPGKNSVLGALGGAGGTAGAGQGGGGGGAAYGPGGAGGAAGAGNGAAAAANSGAGGGGGSPAGAGSTVGLGGAGGACIHGIRPASYFGTSETVTVGAGGASNAGTTTTGGAGGSGIVIVVTHF